jgi:hypothetical protein
MNIKVVRLVSGEELIGDWDSIRTIINNPVVMVPIAKDQLGFQPWIPYSKDEDVQLKEQHIMTVLTPDKKLQNEYNKVYGSGLILPDSDKFIH